MDSKDNLRALVVEDVPETAQQVRKILERKFSLAVEVAPDCASARRLLAEEAFDVVTLDFMLPDGRGLDLLEDITSAGEIPRVIMVTGHGDEESAVRSFRSQASGYVIKDENLVARLAESVSKALLELDLVKARSELERREVLFRSLTEQSSDIITMMRPDGTILYASPSVERFLGYEVGGFVGENLFDLIHPEERGRVRGLFGGMAETADSTIMIDYRVRARDGRWYYLESLGRNLLADPHIAAIVVNSRDITRRKKAEEELDLYRQNLEQLVRERTAELEATNVQLRQEVLQRSRAQEELRLRAERLADFLTIAGHELKHPVSVVKGYTTMLQGYLERMEPEMLTEILGALDTSVDRLTCHVDMLLEASLVEQGMFTFDHRDCDLEELIEDSISDLEGLGRHNPVTLEIADDARGAFVDPVRFGQLMDALLDNAVKFSPESSPIDIEVRKDGACTAVRVADRGRGIPAEARELVFDRFFQVEEVAHHSSVGLGLGLYIARVIVEGHDGEISCGPRPDGGTVFTFTIAPRVAA